MKSGWKYSPEELQLVKSLRDKGQTLAQIGKRIGCAPAAVTRRLEILEAPVPAVSSRKRPCLCCKKPFPSAGNHNRLCIDCRRKDVSPFESF